MANEKTIDNVSGKNCGTCQLFLQSKSICVAKDRKVSKNNVCVDHQPKEEADKPLIIKKIDVDVGRPTKMTEDVINKLEEAYLCNATHLEAATYAGISASTLHDYRKKTPEFSERINILRKMIGLKAKMNVAKSIRNENLKDSKWYLLRYDKDCKCQEKEN